MAHFDLEYVHFEAVDKGFLALYDNNDGLQAHCGFSCEITPDSFNFNAVINDYILPVLQQLQNCVQGK